MVRRGWPAAAGLVLAAVALGALAAGERASAVQIGAEAELSVEHRARAVQPGEVVVLRVRMSETPVRLEAFGLGAAVRFFPADDGRWMALLGIDVAAEPGPAVVEVIATLPDGTRVCTPYPLDVEPKTFPTRRLQVDSRFVDPPAEVVDRILREAARLEAIFATSSPDRWWRGGFLRPVSGDATSSFGRRSVFNGQPRSPHSGTDFRAAAGTPILAPNAGVVVLATELYFSGNVVIIDHGWGLYSYFAHLSSIEVREGDRVEPGAVVGRVGATGRVTGPHLHWTVRLHEARVDPLALMAVVD